MPSTPSIHLTYSPRRGLTEDIYLDNGTEFISSKGKAVRYQGRDLKERSLSPTRAKSIAFTHSGRRSETNRERRRSDKTTGDFLPSNIRAEKPPSPSSMELSLSHNQKGLSSRERRRAKVAKFIASDELTKNETTKQSHQDQNRNNKANSLTKRVKFILPSSDKASSTYYKQRQAKSARRRAEAEKKKLDRARKKLEVAVKRAEAAMALQSKAEALAAVNVAAAEYDELSQVLNINDTASAMVSELSHDFEDNAIDQRDYEVVDRRVDSHCFNDRRDVGNLRGTSKRATSNSSSSTGSSPLLHVLPSKECRALYDDSGYPIVECNPGEDTQPMEESLSGRPSNDSPCRKGTKVSSILKKKLSRATTVGRSAKQRYDKIGVSKDEIVPTKSSGKHLESNSKSSSSIRSSPLVPILPSQECRVLYDDSANAIVELNSEDDPQPFEGSSSSGPSDESQRHANVPSLLKKKHSLAKVGRNAKTKEDVACSDLENRPSSPGKVDTSESSTKSPHINSVSPRSTTSSPPLFHILPSQEGRVLYDDSSNIITLRSDGASSGESDESKRQASISSLLKEKLAKGSKNAKREGHSSDSSLDNSSPSLGTESNSTQSKESVKSKAIAKTSSNPNNPDSKSVREPKAGSNAPSLSKVSVVEDETRLIGEQLDFIQATEVGYEVIKKKGRDKEISPAGSHLSLGDCNSSNESYGMTGFTRRTERSTDGSIGAYLTRATEVTGATGWTEATGGTGLTIGTIATEAPETTNNGEWGILSWLGGKRDTDDEEEDTDDDLSIQSKVTCATKATAMSEATGWTECTKEREEEGSVHSHSTNLTRATEMAGATELSQGSACTGAMGLTKATVVTQAEVSANKNWGVLAWFRGDGEGISDEGDGIEDDDSFDSKNTHATRFTTMSERNEEESIISRGTFLTKATEYTGATGLSGWTGDTEEVAKYTI